MRLINAETLKLHNFASSPTGVPQYAILSHTWGTSEVDFRELRNLHLSVHASRERTRSKAGYWKIKKCCAQALEDGVKWVWVDTCCIDKRSSAELSEAINSMFKWYQNAAKCYAYLDDIDIFDPMRTGGMMTVPTSSSSRNFWTQHIDLISEKDLSKARWFTRGWTLQELIAPKNVIFYIRGWNRVGDKISMKSKLSRITGIEEWILESGSVDAVSVAQRMSWASRRTTTRVEDLAYCLLGIFDVNMPLLYGEGDKAFKRLQEEIIKDSDDQSIFAWNPPGAIELSNPWGVLFPDEDDRALYSAVPQALGGLPKQCSILARHPSDFAKSGAVMPLFRHGHPFVSTNKGVRMEIPLLKFGPHDYLGVLECGIPGSPSSPLVYMGIVVSPVNQYQFVRRSEVSLVELNGAYTELRSAQQVFLVKKVPRERDAREDLGSRLAAGNASSSTLVEGLLGSMTMDGSEEAEEDSDGTLLDD